MHLLILTSLKDFECENCWWQSCDNGSHLGSIQEVSSQQWSLLAAAAASPGHCKQR